MHADPQTHTHAHARTQADTQRVPIGKRLMQSHATVVCSCRATANDSACFMLLCVDDSYPQAVQMEKIPPLMTTYGPTPRLPYPFSISQSVNQSWLF